MRYLNLAEALVIAEAVTGLDTTTLSRSPGIDLLDSALHKPPSVDKSSTPTSSTKQPSSRCESQRTIHWSMATSASHGAASPCSSS